MDQNNQPIQTPEQQPQEPQQPQDPKNNNAKGFSIAALVCGILGIVGAWIPVVTYFTFVLAILGIVFGAMGRKRALPNEKGLATAGLVLGIISTALSVVGIICVACIGAAAIAGGLA